MIHTTGSRLPADVVWPALLLEKRLLGVLPIVAGLIVEYFALRFGGFNLSWKRAAIIDLVMNTASTAIGVVLIPLLGFGWEYFPGIVIYKLFDVGTFNPGTWAATFLIAVFVTTGIEASVVRWLFKVDLRRRGFWILFAANFVSVGIALVSLFTRPPEF